MMNMPGPAPRAMARTNIEIDDETLAVVMRRYGIHTKTEAVDLALRRLAGEPMSSSDGVRECCCASFSRENGSRGLSTSGAGRHRGEPGRRRDGLARPESAVRLSSAIRSWS